MVIGVARSQGGFHYVGNDKTRHERKTVASGITRAGYSKRRNVKAKKAYHQVATAKKPFALKLWLH